MANYHTYNDEHLLELMKYGDQAAFESLYNRYWKRLFGLAVFKLKNPAEAEEILQDIFLDLWRRRDELSIQTRLSSYLSASLSYRVVNYFAKMHRQHQHLNRLEITEADHSTEQILHANDLDHHIASLVGELPEKCQLVFRLSRQEALSHRQIAEQLEISEKTVESHLTRALRFLRTGIGLAILLLAGR